jgi:hypothetical protein
MSIAAILHALNHSKAVKAHQLILIRLADHATDSGLSWPSHSLLARETGYTRRYVITAIQDLIRFGSIRVVLNHKGQERYQLFVYDTKHNTCSCEQPPPGCELSSQAPKSTCELSSEGVNSLASKSSHPNGIPAEPLTDEPVQRDGRFGLSTDEADEFDRRYTALYGGN